MILEELLQNLCREKKTVCLAGAGGKTSLIFRIAEAACAAGKKVLVTTTTHIFQPEENFAHTSADVMDLWNAGKYAVIGEEAENHKLTFYEELYKCVSPEADLILIEADGSKRLPCKVPAAHEPVILPECDLVIGVMGMTAIGKPLKDICFRFESEGTWLREEMRLEEEKFQTGGASSTEVAGCDINRGDILSPQIAARILCDERGTRKCAEGLEYIVVLNQCDDHELMCQAEKVKEEIKRISDLPVICTSLLKRK